KSETHYVLGKMVGTHTSYYPNGQIMCIRTTDSSGEYNGQHIIFYNDGDTAVTKEYSRGKKTGTWTSYYQSGKINKKASYIENRIDSYREYSEEGKLLNQLNQGSGTISSSEKKGYSSSSSYQNGLKHGNSITYRADTLYSSRTYKNGIWTNPKTKVEREYAKDTAYFNFTYAYLDSNWQQKATFDKGEAGLQRHLAFNTVFPSEALENDMQGTVHSLFVVGKEGQVTDQKTEGTKHGFGLEEEAIRVVKSTEYFWRPATQVGFPVHMRFRIPIKFQIF
ncbi:MAG: TonB family protein, partial [Bacteroidia bacterium]